MAKRFLMGLGIALFVIGLIGTFTGGHDHVLAGLGINASHNMVHIVSGVLAMGMAWAGEGPAHLGCQLFAVVYGVVTLAGFAGVDSVERGLNLNLGDNLLHLAITLGAAWFGFRHGALPIEPRRRADARREEREPAELGRR